MKRDPKVMRGFKERLAADGDDCCEVCRWRPPRILRDLAGGRIDRLLHGHHIVPVACGGADDESNMIQLCPTCHALAHYLGRIHNPGGDYPLEWWGPPTRVDLVFAFRLLKNPTEFRRFVKLDRKRNAYLAVVQAEAIEQDKSENIRITRAFTVIRGKRA